MSQLQLYTGTGMWRVLLRGSHKRDCGGTPESAGRLAEQGLRSSGVSRVIDTNRDFYQGQQFEIS